MEKASLYFLKLAIFALLISAMVPVFGEGQMVIEEVVLEKSKMINRDEEVTAVTPKVTVVKNITCAELNQMCNHDNSGQPVCCDGLVCSMNSNTSVNGYCTCRSLPQTM
uniref:Bifunctional inhibitor/plant lipid transfer protein/seed storage helical domain-containing protein n=1 Tax=Opuntia streptacantha TaxID=393608 RepID=A0A7C9D591_OPUST